MGSLSKVEKAIIGEIFYQTALFFPEITKEKIAEWELPHIIEGNLLELCHMLYRYAQEIPNAISGLSNEEVINRAHILLERLFNLKFTQGLNAIQAVTALMCIWKCFVCILAMEILYLGGEVRLDRRKLN